MLKRYEDILCVTFDELVPKYFASEEYLKVRIHRDKKKGKGLVRIGTTRPGLVSYDSLPDYIKEGLKAIYGDVYKIEKHGYFKGYLKPDHEAIHFFSTYIIPEMGITLPLPVQKEYHQNAMFLNAILRAASNSKAQRNARGGKMGIWQKISEIINDLQSEYGHSLPANYLRLKEKAKLYATEGHSCLIHKGYGSQNSRKVTEDLERLLLSIYVMSNKPFVSMVLDIYLEFLAGKVDFVDMSTGELFDRANFKDKKGLPLVVSEATAWNYINDPKNRAIVDAQRNDFHTFNNMHRPHHHRHAPKFSLSMVSLDDRDLPRKELTGQRVKAYYAYEVTSGAVVGASYSMKKDTELFVGCIRNMFEFLNEHNYGFPMEMQVEHHLVNKFKDDLMKAGEVFPFVRWCNPGNSQEKFAETFNGQKKYGYEKRYQDGIGRFYAKLEANLPKQNKEWTEAGMSVVEKRFSFERLCADDRFTIEQYNNGLHRDQKRFPGKTRIQVLNENVNPELVHYNPAFVARYTGKHTQSTIRRNQYLQVNYGKYQLPEFSVVELLQPNNYTVDAYWLPSNDKTVYIYQNNRYICECKQIETYNAATSERTEQDEFSYTEQSKYVSNFDKEIRTGKATKTVKLQIIQNDIAEIDIESHSELKVKVIPPPEPLEEFEYVPSTHYTDF